MSEPSTEGAPAPTTTTPEPAPAPAPPADPKPDPPKPKDDGAIKLTSEQLKERLDRQAEAARRDLLKSIGIEDLAAVKAAVQAAKDREEAQKTLEERLAEQRAEHERTAARLSTYETAIRVRAESELASLTEAQRTAVSALAGDDPADKLRAIDALRPTWASPPPEVIVEPAKPAPATTSPPRSAPTDGTPAPTDHRAHYERLKESNPLAAAQYLNRVGPKAIFPG